MTLDQWAARCALAIDANFRSRNVRVFSNNARHQLTTRVRRATVRRWIVELRLAKNPATSSVVAQNVVHRVVG
jgi:hypothetical protein